MEVLAPGKSYSKLWPRRSVKAGSCTFLVQARQSLTFNSV